MEKTEKRSRKLSKLEICFLVDATGDDRLFEWSHEKGEYSVDAWAADILDLVARLPPDDREQALRAGVVAAAIGRAARDPDFRGAMEAARRMGGVEAVAEMFEAEQVRS